MPINNFEVTVPTTGEVLDTGWAFCAVLGISQAQKTMRILYWPYASKSKSYAGLPPLEPVEIQVLPTAQPAITSSVLISEGVPAQYGEQGVVISEEVLPVYSTTVVRPSVPSYDELIATHAAEFAALATALDTFALTVCPEFAGGEIEGVTGA